ncbi:acetyl-CoA carboxylase biotin carboxyl carrier protein [Candidatus Endomicrobiellum trichonymphae]|uniref:Biotin carboxyl carrier protein of acetyl-CoA carboxylase n=1 Tax=Endomicrobium trichonymphae TaxID=1408204 RepID=B1GZI9_ENDTX|nr:biotin/lipoyl-containing protein [Candidatus Endomicrobium trichonymphae]BAG13671.1 biotin carboxyl carrier protein of acetyl-CoA carboxylase [Candidatus Endomicrobium trichonymphae]
MNSQEVKELLKSIKDTDIEEIQYQSGDNSLYLKKTDVKAIAPDVKEAIETEVKVKNKKEEDKKIVLTAIKSTMVGTFASAQSNDKPPFVREGDNIVVGQKIGQIEAMKIIKDILSNIKGRISKILVSNGQSVEYGQELFLVDTSKQCERSERKDRVKFE